MTQKSKTTRRYLLVAALGIVLVFTTALPSRANACGYRSPSDDEMVRQTIARHARALMQGDAKAIQANWDLKSGHSTTVVAEDGKESVRDESIAKASRRWSEDKDESLQFKIESVDVDQGAAFAKLSLTWHGQKRIEYLTLLRVSGAWKLVGKVHVAAEPSLLSTAKAAKVRY